MPEEAEIVSATPDLRRRVTVGRWVKVSERKPPEGVDVDTKFQPPGKKQGRNFIQRAWLGEEWGWRTSAGPGSIPLPETQTPTHWAECAVWIDGEPHPFSKDLGAKDA